MTISTDKLDSIKFNAIFIVVAMILAWIIGLSTNLSQSSGHGGMIPLIMPPFQAAAVLVVYFISRIFTKKYNWVISVLGVLWILISAIDFYITENI